MIHWNSSQIRMQCNLLWIYANNSETIEESHQNDECIENYYQNESCQRNWRQMEKEKSKMSESSILT